MTFDDDVPGENAETGEDDAAAPAKPPVVTIAPDRSYAQEFRERAVQALGEDGAWLMLSMLHYAWRAHYDLARSIPATVSWRDDDPLGPHDEEFQITRDLEVQAHMYAVAEQLASLVDSLRAMDEGGDFFESYVSHSTLRDRIDRVTGIPRDELAYLLGVPADADSFGNVLRHGGFLPSDMPTAGRLDPANIPTTEVAGLLVPRSAMNRAVSESMWDRVNGMVNGIHRNLSELLQFVDRPTPLADIRVRPQSLREVDNSFRHGFRVLFHRAVPNERNFRAVHLDEEGATHHVDLFLPRQGEQVSFATVACSPERTDVHIETIRILALRIGQVVRCALGRLVLHHPGSLVAAASVTLGGADDAGQVSPV